MILVAVPVSRCQSCGAAYRDYVDAVCPVCYGRGDMTDAAEFMGKKGPHGEYTGRTRMPGETQRPNNREQQVAAVNILMAEGMLKTAACIKVGITPRAYGYWCDRSQV